MPIVRYDSIRVRRDSNINATKIYDINCQRHISSLANVFKLQPPSLFTVHHASDTLNPTFALLRQFPLLHVGYMSDDRMVTSLGRGGLVTVWGYLRPYQNQRRSPTTAVKVCIRPLT